MRTDYIDNRRIRDVRANAEALRAAYTIYHTKYGAASSTQYTQTSSSPYALAVVPEAIYTIGADQRVGTSGLPDQFTIVWAWEGA